MMAGPLETSPDPADDHAKKRPAPPSPKLFWFVGAVVVAMLGIGAVGHYRTHAAAKETQQQIINDLPNVRVTAAKVLSEPIKVTLPGQTMAFDQANIYARATGYVALRKVDIGSQVKQGDLLAKIASPDLDRQLDQAEAQLLQVTAAVVQARAQVGLAEANLKLGNVTYSRIGSLAAKGYETLQNRDNQAANVSSQQANVEAAKAGVKVAEANVEAQQATVNRLKVLTGFEEVRAPFDGVVSVRNVDVGDLVNADSGAGTSMFNIVKDNTLRVAVNVPQSLAVGIRDGLKATVHVFELPGKIFSGTVARNSGALQSTSRTLPVQVDVENNSHILKAGIFVNVEIDVPREHPSLQIPAEALIFNKDGLRAATVSGDIVHLKAVKIYRDFGESVELESGLDPGDQVILNPPTDIHENQHIKVDSPPPADAHVASEGQNSERR